MKATDSSSLYKYRENQLFYPDAKIARPPVQRCAISAEHSDLEVGLESGKMIGGLGDWFIAVKTSSEKEKNSHSFMILSFLFIDTISGADARNISGLLKPKKLGNFNN